MTLPTSGDTTPLSPHPRRGFRSICAHSSCALFTRWCPRAAGSQVLPSQAGMGRGTTLPRAPGLCFRQVTSTKEPESHLHGSMIALRSLGLVTLCEHWCPSHSLRLSESLSISYFYRVKVVYTPKAGREDEKGKEAITR